MLKVLRVSNDMVSFEIPLALHVLEICGDSGEGKTLLYNLLKEKKSQDSLPFKCVLINYENRVDLRNLIDTDALYVIDDADLILQAMPEAVNIINTAPAQFILLGRDFTGIECNLNACGYLTEKDHKIIFKSLFQRLP